MGDDLNTTAGLAQDLRRVAATGLPRRDRAALEHAAHILKAMGPGVEVEPAMNPTMMGVFKLIACERGVQDSKFGTGADVRGQTPDRWLSILTEEHLEVAREVLDGGTATALRGELVQVAAVAVRWLELGIFS